MLEVDRPRRLLPGVAFRVARAEAEAELELVWRREMVTGAYVPRWVKLHGPDLARMALPLPINREAPNYVRPARRLRRPG